MPFILYSIWHYVGFLVERRTKIVAGKSRHSVSFYNWNPRVKSLAGRSRHRVSIFNQNPRLTLRWRHFTSFFGQIFLFRAIEGDDGRATLGRKRNPMCFQPTKGRSTRAKREQNARNMRETRERHARNMRVFPAADYTAPAPSSPSFIEIVFAVLSELEIFLEVQQAIVMELEVHCGFCAMHKSN